MIRRFFLILILSILFSVVESIASETGSFPKSFKWCASTAAHQIEGNNTNSDWWQWEEQGHTKNGAQSGLACDSWNRSAEDIELLKNLGIQQYRLSVEWAKIEPKPGHFSTEALNHYKDEMIQLRKAGITPLVTLNHYTLPQWFAQEGGWEAPSAPAVFARYVTAVRDALGENVHDWITFNEPNILLFLGYLNGTYPPAKKDSKALGRAIIGVLKAHALAYAILHDGKFAQPGQKVRVGFAHALIVIDPRNSWNPFDRLLAYEADSIFNWSIPESIKTGVFSVRIPFLAWIHETIPGLEGSEDFFGINYYTRNFIGISLAHDTPFFSYGAQPGLDPSQRSDLGWEIYPEGLYRMLKRVHELNPTLPVLITENGIADAQDTRRKKYITTHLQQVARALSEQIPVESYCYWSLLDNFEWNEGFPPRFGLFQMDYATQKRTPRPSALFYGEIVKRNGLSE